MLRDAMLCALSRRDDPAAGPQGLGQTVWQLPRLLLVGVVRLYQHGISPWFPASCRYTPTCSEYAVQALRRYGALRGTVLAVWRIARCQPWGGHGYDPPRWFGEKVPPRTPSDGTDSTGRG